MLIYVVFYSRTCNFCFVEVLIDLIIIIFFFEGDLIRL